VGGDEAGFLSDAEFLLGDGGGIPSPFAGLGLSSAGVSGFDRVRLVLFNLGLVWLVGNLIWGVMVMSVLLFIR
jgi:hypothetical protein